jgi:peptidoglycan-N-acetylglucosamine deacetylase
MMPDFLAERIPGRRRCIVSLCYDDALPCHHETVGPMLEAHGLLGTFYVPIKSRLLQDVDRWRSLAAAGHELGNHTIFHPCYEPAWLDPVYHLKNYTPRRWGDEVELANKILQLIDGRVHRSFGNTCHENRLGTGDQLTLLETLAPRHFVAARGEHTGRPVDLRSPNWFNLGTKGLDGVTFEEVRVELENLSRRGGWMIFTLHGIGPRDHELHMLEDEHAQLVSWLGSQRERILTAPVRDVVNVLRGDDASGAALT